MRVVVLLVSLAGCGRFAFDDVPAPDAALVDAPRVGDAAVIDASPDSPRPLTCVERWQTGALALVPRILPNVNTTEADLAPFIAADGTTLYFASGRNDPTNPDVFRATAGADFADVTLVADLSAPETDGAITLSADGLVATVSTDRPGLAFPGRNLWEATRADIGSPFSGFTGDPFVNVNTAGTEYEHWQSPDRLRLYLASDTAGVQHIALASRLATADVFSVPVDVPELASTETDCCVSLSADERVLVFSSRRAGELALFYATRAARTKPFSTPIPVPIVPPDGSFDLHTSLTADACTLYFSSSRPGAGGFDLWVADL